MTALPLMTREEVEALLAHEFPQLQAGGRDHVIEEVGPLTARLRLLVAERHLRPGGTVSGPAMMGVADLALYVAVLANAGPVPLALTTNLSFSFLRKPERRDLIARCRLLRLGKRLAVGEVSLAHDGQDEIVCHAIGTYSVPPR